MAGQTVNLTVFHCDGGSLVSGESRPMDGVESIYRPCTGSVTLAEVVAALGAGTNGVLLVGCPADQCRFPHPAGCPAERLGERARTLARMLGLGEQRVAYARCGSVEEIEAQAGKAMKAAGELGPNPLRPDGKKA